MRAEEETSLGERIAAGPISWGICEVPGWGFQLPADRVLAEIRLLGLHAVEAGPVGYLGTDAAAIRELLAGHGLVLVGGFLPVVLHDRPQRDESLGTAREIASLYEAAGGRVLVSACVVDLDWSPRVTLSDDDWRSVFHGLERLDELARDCGLAHVLHPHVGTLVETAADVERVLEGSDVQLCLDTGHLTLGGADPAALARTHPGRIGHVHLKDVRGEPATALRSGRLTLVEAVQAGLFCPLGEGEAAVAETVVALERAGYSGWYVLEQDAAIREDAVPAPGTGPSEDVHRSIEFLRTVIGAERATSKKEALA